MTLAERIWWFYRDNCDTPPQVALLGTVEFLNEVADYLLTIVGDCQRGLKKLGCPDDFDFLDQRLYDDHIETHNRAVDLFNDLMEYGLLR